MAPAVNNWRTNHYKHEFSVIAEILEWAREPNGAGFKLRPPQLRALETYWYLRLVEKTPHVIDLHKKLFTTKRDLREALGVSDAAFSEVDYDITALFDKIMLDDAFVRKHQLATIRESLTLDYSSYIFALAMGSGKTALIGSIIATEFAMAFEYPDGPFVKNALVFAPGLTIIGALRELAEVPYNRIIPPRFFGHFASSAKLTFTRDGDPDIPIIPGSIYNVVVTNTEKIRIQKDAIRSVDIGSQIQMQRVVDEARIELANRRLQAIASLPHLGVFSDEAHHTYGQALDNELKKVRRTVDYLHQTSPNLICVVNTTGTPYFQKHLLRDVVIWYGLSEGIHQGILKDLSNNIFAYDFDQDIKAYLNRVIEDFFAEYKDVALPDGTPAKLAMYFPQTDDVRELRPVIEAKLAQLGIPTTFILEHHTNNDNPKDFDRFASKDSPHRIALLVARGVEGWNVPALFACALVRRLQTSNNFVLQAACRCLRQVPGNTKKARIYLSIDNRNILDRQLQETFGECIQDLNRSQAKNKGALITLKKLNIPPLYVKRKIRSVIRKAIEERSITLSLPQYPINAETLTETRFTVAEQESSKKVLVQAGDAVIIESVPLATDCYTAAVDIAATYRLDIWHLHDELTRLYPSGEVPNNHLEYLRLQIEEQTRQYEVREETVEKALALVKLDGFDQNIDSDGTEVYTAEITYPIDKEHLIKRLEEWPDQTKRLGFHYTPYNFDSQPESNFFELFFNSIDISKDAIEDIYFTGAITDPKKTDFYVEYKGEDDNWHKYTPDFILRCKNGKALIVEIKAARFEKVTDEDLQRHQKNEALISVEGRKAVALKQWQELNPDLLKYQIIYSHDESVPFDKVSLALQTLRDDCTV